MFSKIRKQISANYKEKAHEEITRGDFRAIIRSLEYLEKSISVTSPSKELVEIGKKMKAMIEEYTTPEE